MLAGLLVALCGWVAFAVYGEAAHGQNLDGRVQILNQQNTDLQQQIADRQREIGQAQTSAWLEEQARKLGYVFPGEKIYVLVSPGAAVPAGGGVDAKLPTFSPSPGPSASPGANPASPSAQPSGQPSALASPTPYNFSLGSPPPH